MLDYLDKQDDLDDTVSVTTDLDIIDAVTSSVIQPHILRSLPNVNVVPDDQKLFAGTISECYYDIKEKASIEILEFPSTSEITDPYTLQNLQNKIESLSKRNNGIRVLMPSTMQDGRLVYAFKHHKTSTTGQPIVRHTEGLPLISQVKGSIQSQPSQILLWPSASSPTAMRVLDSQVWVDHVLRQSGRMSSRV